MGRSADYRQHEFDAIKSSISTAWESVKSATSTAWSNIQSTLSSTWDNLRTTASTKFDAIKSSISTAWGNISSSAWTWGSDICSNLAQGIQRGLSTVGNAVTAVADKIKSLLGFSEPEEGPLSNFHTYMPDMLNLMAKGILDNTYKAENAAYNLANSVSEILNKSISPALALSVDTSALGYYDTAQFSRSISANLQTSAEITADGFEEIIERFYREYVQPTMNQIADDMRRQADKDEHPVVQIGNRVITDAVETQRKANGYSFAK